MRARAREKERGATSENVVERSRTIRFLLEFSIRSVASCHIAAAHREQVGRGLFRRETEGKDYGKGCGKAASRKAAGVWGVKLG